VSRLALLKIPVDAPQTPAALGDSERPAIGDWIIALAHVDEPGWDSEAGAERSPSLAKGIVSGKARQVDGAAIPMLQTDLNPVRGYAGAPLADMNGQVIGLIDTGLRPEGSFGISFAVPINEAKRVLAQLRSAGEVKHGWLGVQVQPLTPVLASRFGAEAAHGALVSDVLADTPAAKASIEPGDVIVEFAGHAIAQSRDLSTEVSRLSPGTQVDVVVLRNGARQKLAAVLGAPPERPVPAGPPTPDEGSQDRWGLEAEEWSPELAERFGLASSGPGSGLVVTEVQPFSAAERAELSPGDILREANGKLLMSRADLDAVLAGGEPLLRVQRGRTTVYRVLQRLTP
jgi:serine protease Do